MNELTELSRLFAGVRVRGAGDHLLVNATDMLRASESLAETPSQWLGRACVREKMECLANQAHEGTVVQDIDGSTWLHWTLALDYAQDLSDSLWFWHRAIIGARLRGSVDHGAFVAALAEPRSRRRSKETS